MIIKLICCDVFARIVCGIISKSPHIVDVDFLPMLSHNEPAALRTSLQECIDLVVTRRKYDKVVLGYGLCGNSVSGLHCDIPMIIPRVHDCCALFLGSKARFISGFGNRLSARWCSNGYYERGYVAGDYNYYESDGMYKTSLEYLQLVEKYGEDDAEYVWSIMHPGFELKEAVYIRIEGYEYNDSLSAYKRHVEDMGCSLEVLNGDIRLLEELVNGPWGNENFLHVMPHEKIVPVYDMDVVMRAE